MQTGESSSLHLAQRMIADSAIAAGARVVYHKAAPPEILEEPLTPLAVKERASEMGEDFLSNQPNLVLRFGSTDQEARTVMFNVHLDTVGEMLPTIMGDGRVAGRGAVDMKGPAVAVLAGLEAVATLHSAALEEVAVLLQCVGGEEGGALGTYGTRELVRQGFVGSLNVFAEPTLCRYMDRCTASMTAQLSVSGQGVTDDACEDAMNATVLLGWLACQLPRRLARKLRQCGVRLCVAGLHTGSSHDRVYGEGVLLFNLIYTDLVAARHIERAITRELRAALEHFQELYRGIDELMVTASSAIEAVELTWLKRQIPALTNRSPFWEAIFADLGIDRVAEDDTLVRPFTCDAIWAQSADAHCVVLGPGHLGRNGAHTPREYVEIAELERYADIVRNLVLRVADRELAHAI